ncbi:type II toxin-antitoxin system RatA family toxin [Streptomyces sp. NPDC101733]|uniref:type II toxin-antitoxin system RatA family toxin n=1 Tax=unclassified Streptomyces TaxID=2593676 RepID=UPI00380CB7CF
MRHVELDALVPAQQAGAVLDAVRQWERFPELAPHVNATTVHEDGKSSSWELHFRSGLLRWTEEDEFLPEQGEIRFVQSEGDFDSFNGVWKFRQDGDDVAVRFDGEFDFGIPSLEGILDPIAERVIRETVAWALTGLFPATRLVGADELTNPATVSAA